MGCFAYPQICYGWIEPNEKEIQKETLEKISEKYNIDFNSFSGETNHGIKCYTVYGIMCNFNANTGEVYISNKDKNKIEKIYNLWKLKNNIENDSEIEFHLVINGDIDSYNNIYYDFEIDE